MGLYVTRDHDEIRRVLDRIIAADPIRHTIFGSVAAGLTDAWCASADDGAAAARSELRYPLTMTRWADVGELAPAVDRLPGLEGVSGPCATVDTLLAELPHRRVEQFTDQRLFRCDELVTPRLPTGSARIAGTADRGVVGRWFAEFMAEAMGVREDADDAADEALRDGGAVWLWCTPRGTPVSLARARAAAGGSARVGPVYTPPEERGRGYASAVTAAATASIATAGAVPVLFTDLANPVSNAIYPRLGYRPVEDFRHAHFGPPSP